MRIALAGNPNSGKTTLFNAITGACIKLFVDKKNGVHCSGCLHSKLGNQNCNCSNQLPCKEISEVNSN